MSKRERLGFAIGAPVKVLDVEFSPGNREEDGGTGEVPVYKRHIRMLLTVADADFTHQPPRQAVQVHAMLAKIA